MRHEALVIVAILITLMAPQAHTAPHRDVLGDLQEKFEDRADWPDRFDYPHILESFVPDSVGNKLIVFQNYLHPLNVSDVYGNTTEGSNSTPAYTEDTSQGTQENAGGEADVEWLRKKLISYMGLFLICIVALMLIVRYLKLARR